MGFLLYNNDIVNRLNLYYLVLKPTWKIINSTTTLALRHNTLYKPNSLKSVSISVQNQTTYTNFWTTNLWLSISPLGFHDFYEPRVWGWLFKTPLNYSPTFVLATDSRKMFKYSQVFVITNTPGNHNFYYSFECIPRLRISDHLQIGIDIYAEKNLNNFGWVETGTDSLNNTVIYFGRRDISTWNNIISGSYIFNTRMSLTLRLRHYWSQARYLQYYTLNHEGTLDYSNYSKNNDINFNAFSVDLQYTWYFAPGSEMSVVWKNQITSQGTALQGNYLSNLSNTLGSSQSNSFSIKVLYYIDYMYLRKWFRRKTEDGG